MRGERVTGWFARRLAPPAAAGRETRDLALEGLRGICACLVLYAHMTIPSTRLDPDYAPSARFWWFNLGMMAVLFFFVLSGYVIGLATRSPFSGPEARGYLGRRLLRLVPVNTAAVLLSWAFIPHVDHVTVLGNLGFLQNFKPYPVGGYVDVMPDNLNLWSLNFEAFYYVAFLAVWWLAPPCGIVLCAAATLTLAAALVPGDHVMAACYVYGALYWFGGLAVAWWAPREGRAGNWPSAMLATLVMWPLAPLQRVLFAVHLPDPIAPLPTPSLHRLDLLPVAVWLLLAVTGRATALQRWLAPLCLLMASAALACSLAARNGIDSGALACYAAALALAWALVAWKPEPSALARLAPIGAISFGIYAVGFPIQYALFKTPWLPAGSAATYAVRACLLAALTFGVGWMLDARLQPTIRRIFRRRA